MATLYLMRHGQTEYNVRGLVQGHCDSPLTAAGLEQAIDAGRWIASQGVGFARICTSPLGRAHDTADIVRGELVAAAAAPGSADAPEPPAVEVVDGLIERDYGPFEGGPKAKVPGDLWDPGEAVVPYGGEGSAALRRRMTAALTELMLGADGGNVLAVSHGSATRQFKLAWERFARCPQDAPIGNCCVMVYEFDPAAKTFANTAIVNRGDA